MKYVALHFLLFIAFITLAALAGFAQEASRKEGKDLWRKYDKYRDVTIIGTEATDVLAKTSNMQTAAALVVAALVPKDGGVISDVAMVFYPEAASVAGNALQSAAKYKAESRDALSGRNAYRNGQVYFQPFAEAILLIGAERFKLLPATKEFGLAGDGRFKDSVVVAVPVDVFAKLAGSGQWSIAIGDVALGIGDPDLSKDKKMPGSFVKRVQPRLLALRDRIAEINSSAPQSAATAPREPASAHTPALTAKPTPIPASKSKPDK